MQVPALAFKGLTHLGGEMQAKSVSAGVARGGGPRYGEVEVIRKCWGTVRDGALV